MTTWRTTDNGDLDLMVLSFDGLAVVRQVYSGECWLTGWTIAASAPATALVVQLLDGADTLGDPFALLRIPADTTLVRGPALPGQPLRAGLTINPLAGAVSGSVTIGRPIT